MMLADDTIPLLFGVVLSDYCKRLVSLLFLDK